MSCATCGAKSHKTKQCPKTKVEEEKGGGRGLSTGNRADQAALEICLEKLAKDTTGFYNTGAKSLIGGRKGKPSGLDDKSYRVDRQSEGNVQFQKGDVSLAKVTFGANATPGAVMHGLRLSLQTGEIVDL